MNKFFIDSIIRDWAWQVNDGMPDPKKRTHLQILEDVLRDYKYSEEFINEYISQIGVNEATYVDNPQNRKIGRVGKEYGSGGKDSKTKDSKTKDDDTSVDNKYPKKASGPEWEGKNTDEIIDAVSRKEEPTVVETKGPSDVSNRSKKSREKAFGGKAGKGGGDTTIQEEMTNIGREITNANPNMTKEELGEAIAKNVKENYPDSKVANNEKKLKKLANASVAGYDSMKEVQANESFDYNKEQPEGYPVNTTDSTVVRDTLATQLREAEKSGDAEKIKHAKNELYEFQKNAGDKSITGKEGDADTIMIFKDGNGNDRVCYISNKQTLNDQQASGTVNSSRRAILSAAKTLNLTESQQSDVVRITEEQFAKANKFDENMAQGVKSAVEKHEKELSTPQAKSTMAKCAQALNGRKKMGKPQDQLSPEEAGKKRKYAQDTLKKPEVQAKLMGADGPPNNDVKSKEYKDWKKKTSEQFKSEGKNYSDDDIVNAATVVTGTGGISKGNQIRTNEKVAIVSRDINEKMQKKIDAGMSPEEAAAELKKEFDKSNKDGNVMYNGVIDEKDFIEIHSNPGLREMEKAERGRKKDIEGMQIETTKRMVEEDEKETGKKAPPNGPRTQAYVKGFLERVHIMQNVGGESDGRKLTEMGEHSVSPQDYRTSLSKITGYEGDMNDNKALEKHLLESVEVEPDSMRLIYTCKTTGKKMHIGTDTHRTGGAISKVGGSYGKDFQNAIAENERK